jgi:YidC/Oxa1 family membrane protein insertase
MSNLWHQILYRPLFNALMLIYHYIPDIGVAIIILTIIIRILLYSSQAKALRAQKRMQEMQPLLQKLQDKYKDDKQKQAKAVMEFYQTHKVSPFASCLPTLIQFPIIIALYQVFRTGLTNSKISEIYKFIPHPTNINPMFLGILNLTKPEHFVLPILAGGTQFIQTWLMMPKITKGQKQTTQEVMSRQMVYFMPLMIVFFAATFPSALPLYWIVVSAFGIFQQIMINKETGTHEKVRIKIRTKNEK